LPEADDYVGHKYAQFLPEREAYEASKAAGQVKVVVKKTEWIPGQGIICSEKAKG
jgi:hypothetical protein